MLFPCPGQFEVGLGDMMLKNESWSTVCDDPHFWRDRQGFYVKCSSELKYTFHPLFASASGTLLFSYKLHKPTF